MAVMSGWQRKATHTEIQNWNDDNSCTLILLLVWHSEYFRHLIFVAQRVQCTKQHARMFM